MTDLQERILQLLKEIDSLCRENDIEYYLAAGTALGAVRHHGFLPWDDDADIYMTADNWKKFYALCDALPENRTLVSVEESFDAGYPMSRYVDLTSTRLFRYLCASPQPAGLIVDILVLDPVADDEDCIKDYIVALTEYTSLLCRGTGHTYRCPYRTDFAYYLDRSKKVGRDRVLTELRDKMLQCTSEDGGVFIQRDATVPHVWKKEVFGKPQYVPFEDTRLPIAEHYYEHLCEAFDEDWINIPDGAGRVTHIKGVNLHISNNNAFSDYEKLVDMKEADDLYTQRYEMDNLQGPSHLAYQWKKLKLADLKVRLYYEKHWQDPTALLDRLLQGECDYLDDYFSEYRVVQCHREFIGNIAIEGWSRSKAPYYIDLGDEFLYVFCRYLLHQGSLHKVTRILKAREAYGPLNDRCLEIKGLTDTIQRACSCMEQAAYTQAYQLAADMLQDYPENKYLNDILFASRYLSGEEEEEAFKQEIMSSDFRDDVLLSIYADILWKEGDCEGALQTYRDLLPITHNGLILQSIKERVKEDRKLDHRLKVKLGEAEPTAAEGSAKDPYMVPIQKCLLDLLQEIDRICTDHQIRYYLIDRSLLSAVRYKGFESLDCELSIAIMAEDVDVFLTAVQESMPDNRYVECMNDSPDFPHLSIHYGSEETLDISATNWGDYQKHGISITVEIIRREESSKFVRLYHQLLESVWRMRDYPETTDKKTIRLYRFFNKRLSRNREASAKKMFHRLVHAKGRKEGRLFINPESRSGRDCFPAKVFAEAVYIDFDGFKVPLPCGYEEVLSREFGSGWRHEEAYDPMIPATRVLSAEIPYRELFQKAQDEGVDLSDVWKARQIFDSKKRKYNYINHMVHDIWTKLFFAGERINQWDDYRGKKEILREAFEEHDTEKLAVLMDSYIKAATEYSREGLGMKFDEEVFGYLKYILTEQGEDTLFKNIEKNVPEQLEVPVVIRTHDGKIVN